MFAGAVVVEDDGRIGGFKTPVRLEQRFSVDFQRKRHFRSVAESGFIEIPYVAGGVV